MTWLGQVAVGGAFDVPADRILAVVLGLSRISCVAAEVEAAGCGWLSASEQRSLAHMRSVRRRDEFLTSRLALRHLLAAVHGGDPLRDWSLDAPENAPPALAARSPSSPIHLGLSHSGDWLLCAVATRPVGVDIERVGPVRDYAGLSAMVCSAAEQQRLAACAPQDFPLQFTRCWTLKEAWLKARGEGIASRPLQTLETEAEVAGPNAWLWHIDEMVLALCLPACDATEVAWAFHGAIQPGPTQTWRVQAP